MEFDEIVVKESPGLCRCCLSEGCYKDLGSEYIWMNETEVYADMLLECFDISITQHNEGPNGPNRLICEVCITRLRDACNFKKQVLDSEKKFIDMMGRGEFRPKMVIYQAQMKCEESAAEPPPEETEVEYLDDDMDFVDDTEEPIKDETEPTVSDITVSSLPIKGKRGRPRKNLVKPEKKAKIAKLEEKPKTSKAVAKDAIAGHYVPAKDNSVGRNLDSDEIKAYIIRILRKTNAMPFRRHENEYKCFYCEATYVLSTELKEHYAFYHAHVDVLENVLIWVQLSTASNLMVDVQNLRCTVCSTALSDINNLEIHFRITHNEIIPKAVFNHVVAFKLSDHNICCFMCNKTFTFFANLLHHMKSRPHLTCLTCDTTFCSTERFNEHENIYCKPCNLCNIRFKSKTFRDEHIKFVHCSGLECDFCAKKFMFKLTLARHIKNVHYKEKNGRCDVCGKTFFNMHYLKMHKVSHTDMRFYECDICKKTFAKNETMKLHRRIHVNDKRFVCEVCGKSFVQWISLHKHKLVHTDEKNIKCTMCEQTFKDKQKMTTHYRKSHIQNDNN